LATAPSLAPGGLYRRLYQGMFMLEHDPVNPASQRIASIDALRGFVMLWIIGGGDVFKSVSKVWKTPLTETLYQQMEHAGWEGLHFLDLIFPLFLFLVGVLLPFSIGRRMEQGADRKALYVHIVKRTLVLILLGLVDYGLLRFDWDQMRWSTVLGRIGICYFFAAFMVIHTGWRTQAIVGTTILFLFWATLTFIPVPGYGPGVLTPEGCLTTYIDQLLIPGKLGLGLYDRQGILSTFTALSTTLLGVLAGHWLRTGHSSKRKTTGLLVAGVASLIVGYTWGTFFFISRNIWTSSFVAYAGGWSLLLLALFYWIVDVKGYRKWAFFLMVIGMNSITIWVGQRCIDFSYTAGYLFNGMLRYAGTVAPVLATFSVLMLKWLFLYFLHRHKIYLKA
jgi:predicted acyltransferase